MGGTSEGRSKDADGDVVKARRDVISVRLPEVDSGASGDESFDTDLEDGESTDGLDLDHTYISELAYTTACDLLNITPSTKVIEHLSSAELQLRYRSLGPTGVKALAAALLHNKRVKVLNLEENGLGCEGVTYIADMLKENTTISYVNLSKNNIGGDGCKHLGSMLKINSSICHLDLSENHFNDHDSQNLAAGIERNERVVHLDLSKNDFSEDGAVHLGRAIGANNSVEELDLSWNQIRKKGAVAICNGMSRNYCISVVNLAWNGFGYEGAVAVGEMLRGNKYLRELDISNNRINWEGALQVMKGLKENDTLEVLKIGYNPLTMTGCLDILEAVDNPISVCNTVGFDGIPVNRKIIYMMERLQKNRAFKMTHGGILESEDVFGKRMVLRCDPLKLLIQFLSDKGIRPVDLFRTFDKDNQHKVSREQFIQGLKKAKVPLDDYELERVLNRLDAAKEGKISYQRLMRGVKEQIKVNRAEEKRKLQEERRQMEEHKRILNLPAITETGQTIASKSITSLSQPRPSSASSISTALTNLPGSLRSYDAHFISSKTSVLSKTSSKASLLSRTSSRASLPKINMTAPLGRQGRT